MVVALRYIFFRDFEALLVLVIPNIRPGLKLEASSHLRIVSFKPKRDDFLR